MPKFFDGDPLFPYYKEEMQRYDPETQDELRKLGLDGKTLNKKREEFARMYGPSGELKYLEFVNEQKKKGRELLEKEKQEASRVESEANVKYNAPSHKGEQRLANPDYTFIIDVGMTDFKQPIVVNTILQYLKNNAFFLNLNC